MAARPVRPDRPPQNADSTLQVSWLSVDTVTKTMRPTMATEPVTARAWRRLVPIPPAKSAAPKPNAASKPRETVSIEDPAWSPHYDHFSHWPYPGVATPTVSD